MIWKERRTTGRIIHEIEQNNIRKIIVILLFKQYFNKINGVIN